MWNLLMSNAGVLRVIHRILAKNAHSDVGDDKQVRALLRIRMLEQIRHQLLMKKFRSAGHAGTASALLMQGRAAPGSLEALQALGE